MWTEDADMPINMLMEVGCQAPGAVGELTVGHTGALKIGSYMMNSYNPNRVIKGIQCGIRE